MLRKEEVFTEYDRLVTFTFLADDVFLHSQFPGRSVVQILQ